MTRLSVLMVSTQPPNVGGLATWTRDVLRSALAERVDITLVDRRPPRLDISAVRASLYKLWGGGRTSVAVLRALHNNPPDVLHLCVTGQISGLLRDWPMLRAARQRGVVTVVHVHGDAARLGARVRLTRRIFRSVSATVVLGRDSHNTACELGFSPVYTVPNGVPLRPLAARDPARTGPIRVLFVGWFIRKKGLFELLDAVANTPDITLTLLGRWITESDGQTCETAVRERIAAADLAGRVALVGEVPHEQVAAYYDQHDLFVLPSHTEGLPMALLEAMSSGLPCVVTPVGAIPDVIDDGVQGLVVPVDDVDALSAALTGWSAARCDTMGAAARQRVVERFSNDGVHRQLEQVWRCLVSA